ncbi:glutathione peroxidase [Pimephales promelas]|nr:glutathione peroxidase [Pimephales promelas]
MICLYVFFPSTRIVSLEEIAAAWSSWINVKFVLANAKDPLIHRCFSSPAQARFIQTTHRHPTEAMGNQKNIWISALVLVALLQQVSGLSDTQVCNPGDSPSKLNALHEEFRDVGFTILGFPCNQFGKQEPGDNNEILPALKYVRPGNGFVPNFPLFEKVDVNGDNEQALFTFLKNACPPVGESFGNTNRLFWDPLKINDIKWNFEKFLVGPDGRPVMRWFPRVNVSEVRADILKYFRQLVQKAD